jgi:hypothetical protein
MLGRGVHSKGRQCYGELHNIEQIRMNENEKYCRASCHAWIGQFLRRVITKFGMISRPKIWFVTYDTLPHLNWMNYINLYFAVECFENRYFWIWIKRLSSYGGTTPLRDYAGTKLVLRMGREAQVAQRTRATSGETMQQSRGVESSENGRKA